MLEKHLVLALGVQRLHTIKDILTKPASKAILIKFAPIRIIEICMFVCM